MVVGAWAWWGGALLCHPRWVRVAVSLHAGACARPWGSTQGLAVGAAAFLGGDRWPLCPFCTRHCCQPALSWSRLPLRGPAAPWSFLWPMVLTPSFLSSPQAHDRSVPHKRGPDCRVTSDRETDLTPHTQAEEFLQGSCWHPLRALPSPADRPECRVAQR